MIIRVGDKVGKAAAVRRFGDGRVQVRRIVAALAAAALPAAILMPASNGNAQSSPPPGTLQSGGGIKAQVDSQVFGINIFAGNFALPIKLGTSGARVDGKTASAAAGALDLGLLGSLAGLALVNTPTLDKHGWTLDFIGPALKEMAASTADSRSGGGALKSRNTPEMVRGPLQFRGATETVSAPEGGPSTSRTTVRELRLDLGVVQLLVGGMDSSTYADPKEIKAVSHLNVLELKIAGVPVSLKNLHWTFDQKLGEAPTSSFVVESGQIGPMHYDMSEPGYMDAGIARINEMMDEAEAGITLRAPTVDADRPGTLSSLRFELKDSKLLADTIGKIFFATISDTYFDWSEDQAAKIPELGLVFTVLNILIGAITGQGGVQIEVGGVGGTIAPRPIETFSYGGPAGPSSSPSPPPTVGPAAVPVATVPTETSSTSVKAPSRAGVAPGTTTPPVTTPPTTIAGALPPTTEPPSQYGGDVAYVEPEKIVAKEKVPGVLIVLVAAGALGGLWFEDRRRMHNVMTKGEKKS